MQVSAPGVDAVFVPVQKKKEGPATAAEKPPGDTTAHDAMDPFQPPQDPPQESASALSKASLAPDPKDTTGVPCQEEKQAARARLKSLADAAAADLDVRLADMDAASSVDKAAAEMEAARVDKAAAAIAATARPKTRADKAEADLETRLVLPKQQPT